MAAEGRMAGDPWDKLPQPELEKLLVERWLYRGGLMAALVVLAVAGTLVASGGVQELPSQILIAAVAALIIAGAAVFIAMRRRDHQMLRELRRRRRGKGEG